MALRSLLVGSKLNAAVTAFAVLTLGIGGGFVLGLIGTPSVVAVDNSFGATTQETTVIDTDIVVHNPYPIDIRLGDTTINYTVLMNDVAMANGSKHGIAIGTGNTTLNFTTRMKNDRIPPWWVSHIRNDEVTTVKVDATVQSGLLGGRTFEITQKQRVETNIIGQFNSDDTRPVTGPSNPLYSNPVLYINETSAEWGTVTQAETPIDMQFTVYNPQLKPYVITEVGYRITMNGIQVGEGATDQPYVLNSYSTTVVSTTPTIDNSKLDDWWVSHLQNGQETHLRIDFYAKIELPTGTEIRVPLNALTYEKTIETDIFGTKGNSSANGSADTPTGSPTPTPTSDGGVTSPISSPLSTPTDGPLAGGDDTQTPAETATETATGDGSLLSVRAVFS